MATEALVAPAHITRSEEKGTAMAEKRLIDANALDAELETLMVRFIDHCKANLRVLNLIEDQACHILQILATAVLLIC